MNRPYPKSKKAESIEFVIMALLFIFIGTFIAHSVYAQEKTSSSCSKTATDAMCTAGGSKESDAKICFGPSEQRCFVLKDNHLVQLVQGGTVANDKINSDQQSMIKKSLTDYVSWLESEIARLPKRHLCKDSVAVDLSAQHKQLCLTGLEQKPLKAKTMTVLAALENPNARKTTSK